MPRAGGAGVTAVEMAPLGVAAGALTDEEKRALQWDQDLKRAQRHRDTTCPREKEDSGDPNIGIVYRFSSRFLHCHAEEGTFRSSVCEP